MADDDVLASDDTPAGDGGTDQGETAPEYTFEGYTIEFSDLVMLEKPEGAP